MVSFSQWLTVQFPVVLDFFEEAMLLLVLLEFSIVKRLHQLFFSPEMRVCR